MTRPPRCARWGAALAWALGLAGGAAAADGLPAEAGPVRALVEARRHAVLSSEIAGRIVRLTVEAGQPFKAGQTLVGFECRSYEAEADVARAQLRAAEVTVRLNRRLNSLKSIGEAEVELAEAKAEAARAELRKAEIQVRRCEVKAPFDGRVVDRRIHEHESVPSGAPLLEVLSDRDLKAELIVPSAWLVWLAPGQGFDLDIDETGDRLRGEVTVTGARVDPASQSVKVTARLLDAGPNLIAGMSGTARFAPAAARRKPGAADAR